MSTLIEWTATAEPGDKFVYHVGHLACDRNDEGLKLGDPALDIALKVDTRAWEAWDLYEKGKVYLRQYRHKKDPQLWVYEAVRR